jgi:hypothetical protein
VTYAEEQQANAQAAKTTVLTLLSAWAMAEVTPDEFTTMSTNAILRANARAVVLADLGLTGLLSAMLKTPLPHLGMSLPATEVERVEAAVQTTMSGSADDYPVRFGRLASAEPLETGRRAWHEALQVQGVEGWTRKASPTACAQCRGLADGSVIPINRKMADHPNCTCVAMPVLSLPDPIERVMTSGHGISRREYSSPIPGLSFSRPRPPRGRIR